jgi:hypothetical protein
MAQRMLGPPAISANALTKKVGVQQTTFSTWQQKTSDIVQPIDYT